MTDHTNIYKDVEQLELLATAEANGKCFNYLENGAFLQSQTSTPSRYVKTYIGKEKKTCVRLLIAFLFIILPQ